MSEHSKPNDPAADPPRVVRETDVTPGTEVADLPHEEDEVGGASEDSFPASDPPAYTGRRGGESDPVPDDGW